MRLIRSSVALVILVVGCHWSGCLESRSATRTAPFEEQDLDAVLAIVIDLSGSYRALWDDKAYSLFLTLSDRFFQGAMGTETRIVISQLSGSDQILLFEGTPTDLRKAFPTPEELNAFLQDNADPSGSRVNEATRRTLDHVRTLTGVGPETRLLTVILSDMQDSELDPGLQTSAEEELRDALHRYEAQGGALALYYVAESERGHWHDLLQEAGFPAGHYVIKSDLTSSPRLPQFESAP